MAVTLVAKHMGDALTSEVTRSSLRVIGDHRRVGDISRSRRTGDRPESRR